MTDWRGIPAPDADILFYKTVDGKSKNQVSFTMKPSELNQLLLAELARCLRIHQRAYHQHL